MAAAPLASGSRRSFLRLSGFAAAAVPLLSEAHFAHAALLPGLSSVATVPSELGPVMINANENPLGPAASALDAISTSARTGGRYDASGVGDRLTALIAKEFGLPPDHVAVYAGSSEPLHYAVLAFTSPSAPYVTPDPSYEAGAWAAQAAGAPILKVPLAADYAHDMKAMVAASPKAGLIYICNPNNPTGTVTPREQILWAEQYKPVGSVLLVDEAYIHFGDVPSVVDLVAKGKDVIVLRTFSKIYGMAGIRCGMAIGRPDLLKKLQRYGMNSLPVTAMAAACASLDEADLISNRREINTGLRDATFTWLRAKGWHYTPSVSNCFMIDTGVPAKDVIASMQAQQVFIGRVWPAVPTYVRISVGTAPEMQRFQTAFETTMHRLKQA